MHLSKIQPQPGFIIDQLKRNAYQGDAYAQHQLLWQLFPEQTDRQFLFRFEQKKSGLCYYVLSQTPPEPTLNGVSVASKLFAPKLSKGDQLAFSLRANPTRMLRSDVQGGRGKRVDVLMHAKKTLATPQADPTEIEALQFQAARDWLADPNRLERAGIGLLTQPQVSGHRQHRVYPKGGKRESNAIQFTSVDFEGLLEVRDPALLLEQISHGIGRAKSFGCGLLMIKRAS